MLQRIEAIPGVRSAAAAVTLPIGGDDFGSSYSLEGKPDPPAGQERRVGFQVVSPRYFATMGIPVVKGREFAPSDSTQAPHVVIVNERLAREAWPGEDAIGKHFGGGGRTKDWLTVVGVVGDIRHYGPAVPPRPEFYQPMYQNSFPFMAIVVRTTTDPLALVPAIRTQIAELDPAQPISNVNTMEAHLYRSKAQPRFMSAVLGGFAVLALVLSAMGIYGTMAYSVTQRTQEFGIRMALGARPPDILRMVVASGLVLTACGAAAGLTGALLLTRFLESQLFETSKVDPVAFAAVTMLLIVVATLAAVIPARRESRVNVVNALRWE